MLKTTAFLGSSTVANSALLLLKNKILALFLGPSGVGLISQLTNFSLILQNWAALGMNTGVVKYVSEYNSKKQFNQTAKLLSTFFRTVLISSLIFAAAGILFSRSISLLILNSKEYHVFIAIVLLGLPFLVFYNFFRSVFRGLLQIKFFVLAGIGSLLWGIVILLPLVYWFHLMGVVWQITLVALFGFLFSYFLFRKSLPGEIKKIKPSTIDRKILKELLKYGMASLVSGSATLLAFLTVRAIVANELGLKELGLLQAAIAISTQGIQIIIETLSTYSYPRISGLLNMEDIRNEINQTFRMAVFFATGSVFLLLLFRELAVVILYSTEFIGTARLLHFQLLGDFFKVVGWSFGVALLPLRKLKAFMGIDVLWSFVFVSLSLLLIPHLGLKGATVAYLFAFIVHATLNYLIIQKATGIRLTTANRKLFLFSLMLLLATGLWYRFTIGYVVLFALLAVLWFKLTVTDREWTALLGAFKQLPAFLRRKNKP